MTDDTDTNELATTDRTPDERTWLSDIESDILVVRWYDTDDILIGKNRYVIMRDTDADEFIVSSVAHST